MSLAPAIQVRRLGPVSNESDYEVLSLTPMRRLDPHISGYQDVSCHILTTFESPYSWEPPYFHVLLPTVGPDKSAPNS